jgi:hypothetical protein
MLRTLLVLLLVLGAPAGAARAGEVAHWEPTPEELAGLGPADGVVGPVLAGDRVAWARGSSFGAWTVVAAVPGARPRTVAKLPAYGTPGHDGLEHGLALFGSPTRLAWHESSDRIDDGKYMEYSPLLSRVLAGPPGGPYTTVADCRPESGGCTTSLCLPTDFLGQAQILLAGDRLLLKDLCADPPRDAVVALAAAPPAVAQTLAADANATSLLAATGNRAVLTATDGVLTAYDLRSGVPTSSYPRLDGTLESVALGEDGTLVAVRQSTTYQQRVTWSRPGEPRAHPLDVPVVDPTRDEVDEGIPFLRGGTGGDFVLHVHQDGAEALARIDLAGGGLRPLVRMGPDSAVRPAGRVLGFAVDGTRVAWAALQCERVSVGVTALDGPAFALPRRVCVAPRVVSSRARADARGRFTVGVTCRRGCHGELSARPTTGGARITARFALRASSAVRRVALRLGPAALRTVREHPLPVDVAIRGAGSGGRRVIVTFPGAE